MRYTIAKLPPEALQSDATLNDFCASFQCAALEILVRKTIAAAEACSARLITLSGGVSCNKALRDQLSARCSEAGFECLPAPRSLSTDNAAMIAFAASLRFEAGQVSAVADEIDPNLPLVA